MSATPNSLKPAVRFLFCCLFVKSLLPCFVDAATHNKPGTSRSYAYMESWVHMFFADTDQKDASLACRHFANSVEYYDSGTIDRAEIARQFEAHHKRWPI